MKKWFMLFALCVSPLLFAQDGESGETVESTPEMVPSTDVTADASTDCGCGGNAN